MSEQHHQGIPRAAATSVTFCLCHGVHVHLHDDHGDTITCAVFSDDQQALNHAAAVVEAVRRRLASNLHRETKQ